MGAVVQEELMALGDIEITVDYDLAFVNEVVDAEGKPKKVHILVYDADGNLICPPYVLLRADVDESGVTIGGRSVLWWLGLDDEGPIIEDREFVSGHNKLSNGDFHLDEVLWAFGSDTAWTIHSGVAETTGNSTPWDILTSQEKFSTEAGQQFALSFTSIRANGTVGKIRTRAVLAGHFKHPDLALLAPHGAWGASVRGDIVLEPDDPLMHTPTFRMQTVQPAMVENGGFEDGLYAWTQVSGAWGTTAAPDGFAAYTDGGGPTFKQLYSDPLAYTPAQDYIPVIPGHSYWFEGWVNPTVTPGFTDIADGFGIITCYVARYPGDPDAFWMEIGRVGGGEDRWTYASREFQIPEGFNVIAPSVQAHLHTVGRWRFDNIKLFRTRGNHDTVTGPTLTAVSGRTYRWEVPYHADPNISSGTAQMRAVVGSAEREPLTLTGTNFSTTPVAEAPGSVKQVASWDITMPPGYDFLALQLSLEDLYNGYVWVGEGTLVDTDPSTIWAELVSPSGGTVNNSTTFTVPTGAESVHLEVAAETNGGGWIVDHFDLHRIGTHYYTHAEVVEELLLNPDTGLVLSVHKGTIVGDDIIPYDYRVQNRTVRDALNHFCSTVAIPTWEYRVNPDRSLDAGADIFTDHSPSSASPVILLPGDIDVAPLPRVEANVEQRPNDIKVIGAARQSATGVESLVTATAEVSGLDERDYNGRDAHRTRLVLDSTVDHLGFATALADELAAQEANPGVSVEATLTGTGQRPDFDVGDHIYAYKPEARLSDPANPVTIEGETVYPKRVRVLSRIRRLGPSFRIDVRRTDGTTFTLGGVRWEPEDTTSLTLGDRLPDFVSDPQGGAVANQFKDWLRWRVSVGR